MPQIILSTLLSLALALAISFSLNSFAHADQFQPGDQIEIGANEGVVVFDISLDLALKRISLDRIDGFLSIPEIKDLEAGKYTRVMALPAGKYRLKSLQFEFRNFRLMWDVSDNWNNEFTVVAGAINYVGRIESMGDLKRRTVTIENTASNARAYLAREFPGAMTRYPWRHARAYPDPYYDGRNNESFVEHTSEQIADSSLGDRDLSEIMFRPRENWVLALSPDGRFALEENRVRDRSTLNLIELSSFEQRTVYRGTHVRKAAWSNSSTLLVWHNDGQIALETKSLANVRPLSLPPGSLLGVVPDTGELVYTLKGRGHEVIRFALDGGMNMAEAKKIRAHQDMPRRARWALLDAAGVVRLVAVDSDNADAQKMVYLDDKGRKHGFNIALNEDEAILPVGFDSKGRILAISQRDREFGTLRVFDYESGELGEEVAAVSGADIVAVRSGRNDEVIAAVYYRAGLRYELPVASATDWIAPLQRKFSGQNVIPIAKAGTVELFFVYGPTEPGQYYVHWIRERKAEPLAHSAPHLKDRRFAQATRFNLRSRDGMDIEAFMTMPDGVDGQFPLLVLPHGGPIDVQDVRTFDHEVQYFAKLGYAVLQVNFRGSAGQGQAFRDSGIRQFGTGMIDDIDDAVTSALTQFPVDPLRIAAMGTSYGAYAAVRLAQLRPDRYRAAIGIAGVYDLPLIFTAGASSRSKHAYEFYAKHLGDPIKDAQLLRELSPVHSASPKIPVLLVQDRRDEVTPFEHALRLLSRMTEDQAVAQLIATDDGGHGLVGLASAIETYPKIATFLRTHLRASK